MSEQKMWTFEESQTISFEVTEWGWVNILGTAQWIPIVTYLYTISGVNLAVFTNFTTIQVLSKKGGSLSFEVSKVFIDDYYVDESKTSASWYQQKVTNIEKGFAKTGKMYNELGIRFSGQYSFDANNKKTFYDPALFTALADAKKVTLNGEDSASFALVDTKFLLTPAYKINKRPSKTIQGVEIKEGNYDTCLWQSTNFSEKYPEATLFSDYSPAIVVDEVVQPFQMPFSNLDWNRYLAAVMFYKTYDLQIAVGYLDVNLYSYNGLLGLTYDLFNATIADFDSFTFYVRVGKGDLILEDDRIEDNSYYWVANYHKSSSHDSNKQPYAITFTFDDLLKELPLPKNLSVANIYVKAEGIKRADVESGEIKVNYQWGCLRARRGNMWQNAFYSKNYKNVVLHLNQDGVKPPSEKDDKNEKADDKNSQSGGAGDGNTPSDTKKMGLNLLTTSYMLTETQIETLGNELWADDFMKNIKLLNSSPIENILSCKIFPVTFTGSTSAFKIGNVSMLSGQTVYKLDVSSTFKKVTGNIAISQKFNSFLDFEPYTSIRLWIPFIGFQPIKPTEFMGANLSLSFTFDVVTGNMTCRVLRNGNTYAKYSGNCATDIPITASNRSQVEIEQVQSGLTALAGLTTGNVGMIANSALSAAVAQNHYNTRGQAGGLTGLYDPLSPYLIIDRPRAQKEISAYSKTYGRPCNLSYHLKDLNGFTSVHDIHLDGVPCLESERDELKSILQKGIII